MSEQIRLIPGEDPDDLVLRAKAVHRPIASVCLFSGGGDSMVTAHRCREHYDELVFIDTGTSVPGVEDFVREAAEWLGKPLRIMRHDFDAYRLLVCGGLDWKGDEWEAFGFPGPAQHGRAYNRLKERQIERLLRELKEGYPRMARVLALTGVRRAESARRRSREPINRKNSMVFVNPLIDWTGADMRRYKVEHDLPVSDVSALLHRSGECNCGAFAVAGEERAMMESLWPEWWRERIGVLEAEAEAKGVRWCRWGGFDVNGVRAGEVTEAAGELCESCILRDGGQMEIEEAAA